LQVCDLGEIRFDRLGLMDLTAILPACRQAATWSFPLLFTIRLQSEGGQWPDAQDDARLPLYLQAMEAVDWLDIELHSRLCPQVISAAAMKKKTIVVSCHDFSGTPPLNELQGWISRITRMTADPNTVIAKIVTTIHRREDHFGLIKLLEQDWGISLCVFGMGARGMGTRVYFPLLGSRLTYGYLDSTSAPGQLSCRDLTECLCRLDPDYAIQKQRRNPTSNG
jgi:3-dehydroquinate dehydratase-1